MSHLVSKIKRGHGHKRSGSMPASMLTEMKSGAPTTPPLRKSRSGSASPAVRSRSGSLSHSGLEPQERKSSQVGSNDVLDKVFQTSVRNGSTTAMFKGQEAALEDKEFAIGALEVQLKKKTNKWKKMYVCVFSTRVLAYEWDKKKAELRDQTKNPKKLKLEVQLARVDAIIDRQDAEGYTFSLLCGTEKHLFRAASECELYEWLITLDGVKVLLSERAALGWDSKRKMLKHLYYDDLSGGLVRSSWEDEWQYRRSGQVLHMKDSLPCEMYAWDGHNLQVQSKSPINVGRGVWNGVLLQWFLPKGQQLGNIKVMAQAPSQLRRRRKKGSKRSSGSRRKKRADSAPVSPTGTPEGSPKTSPRDSHVEYEEEPSLVFLYNSAEHSYTWYGESGVTMESRTWKWSRHFLTPLSAGGHWMVEGTLPEPIAMFIEIMRVCREGWELPAKPFTTPQETE